MGRRGTAAVIAVLFGGLVVGCSPDPAPSPPTPSPTPTWSCTEGTQGPCTEDEAARQKKEIADFAAAEKAFRQFADEWNRVALAGGTTKPTAAMKATADGPILAEVTSFLADQKRNGRKVSSGFEITYLKAQPGVKRIDADEAELVMAVCMDGSKNVITDKKGKTLGTAPIAEGTVYARPISGTWKVWDGDIKDVERCAES